MRAALRLSLNVRRFESDLCELNRLCNEAWIEANLCRLCMRLIRKTVPLVFLMVSEFLVRPEVLNPNKKNCVL